MRCANVLEAVGNTPIIRLNRIPKGLGLKAQVYAKAEYLNPGASMKDRVAIRMIEAAEKEGKIRPGGTIIEGTSGNTGMGLALVAAVKGYKVIFTITDKQSREKIDAMKALGAEVIVCPTAVAPDDPRSYYSVARKLAEEIPNSYYPNQYQNPRNPEAHYLTTGPEIWKDTDGKITHFVAGAGTGGTISGVGKFLKEKNPKVRIVGADPIGSVYYDFFKYKRIVPAKTYKVEGIGEDIFPTTMDFSVVDELVQVTDKECFQWVRRLAREEGIFAGGSTGAALSAALQAAKGLGPDGLVVFLIPDTGLRYLNKVYNDEWMKENRFLDAEIRLTAADLLKSKAGRRLLTARPQETAMQALKVMDESDVSQLPVFEGNEPIGAVYEDDIVRFVIQGKPLGDLVVREIMKPVFPIVPPTAGIDEITDYVTKGAPAVLVKDATGYQVLTKYDIVHTIARDRIADGG